MGTLYPLPDAVTSSGVALTFDLSTATPANPTELSAIGTVAGDLRLVHPTTATSDSGTWYRLDASTDGVSAPNIMASATAGLRWIAIAGTYCNGNASFNGTLAVAGVATLSNATDATALGTGALVLSNGGLSVNGQSRLGGSVTTSGTLTTGGNITASNGVISSALASGTNSLNVMPHQARLI